MTPQPGSPRPGSHPQRLRYWRTALATLGKLLAAQVKAGWWESASDTASRLLSFDPTQEGYVSPDGRSRLVVVKPTGQPFEAGYAAQEGGLA